MTEKRIGPNLPSGTFARPERSELSAPPIGCPPMPEPLDLVERRELCDLFLELGPDAPTLCEGWTTLDLAAHLVLREHFKRWGDERLEAEKTKGLPALVERM